MHNDCNNCYGNKNTDQADLMLSFTEQVAIWLLEKEYERNLGRFRNQIME